MTTGKKVTVAVWEHRHGQDVSVFATAALAMNWRTQIAADNWDEEMQMRDVTRPTDEEIGDAYFEHMSDCSRPEYFSTYECPVEGDETTSALIAAVEYMLPRAHRHLCDEAELAKIRTTLKDARGFEASVGVVGEDVKAAFAGRGKS